MYLQIYGRKLSHYQTRQNFLVSQTMTVDENFYTKSFLKFESEPLKVSGSVPVTVRQFDYHALESYPVSHFKPTIPSKSFSKNPFYTITKFKKILNDQPFIYHDASTLNNTRMTKRALWSRKNNKRSDDSMDSSTLSKVNQSISAHGYRNYSTRNNANGYGDSLRLMDRQYETSSCSMRLENEEEVEKFIQINAESIVAKLQSPPQIQMKKKEIKPHSAHQGPNFPFNLNYMLSHLKAQKSKRPVTPVIGQTFLDKSANSTWGSFKCKVYKKKSNSAGRQFYTECLRQSEFTSYEQEPLKLRPSSPFKGQALDHIRRKEADILKEIFIKHQPSSSKKKSILLSELC